MQGEDQLRLVSATADRSEEAAARLAAALRRVSVTFPSLSPQVPLPYRTAGLVDLGGATYGEVDKLAAWIETHEACCEVTHERQ